MYIGDDASDRVQLPHDRLAADRFIERLVPDHARRRRRLEAIRDAVAADDYENPLKLAVAVDRVLDRIVRS